MSFQGPWHFRFFGELEVLAEGRLLTLPASKKTRALLAYLVLSQRPQRRDHLCRLFWDVTDDPRAALRWSLSKLRAVFECEGESPLVADRDTVSFDLGRAEVDVLRLRWTVARAAQSLPLHELEALADARRGEALEGLDLADFDQYQAWVVSEREELRKLYIAVLAELVERHGTREEALKFARSRVQLDPLNEAARARLIALLGALGRPDEAQQYSDSGMRLERELGRPGLRLQESRPRAEVKPAAPTSSAAPSSWAAPPASTVASTTLATTPPGRAALSVAPWVGRDDDLAWLTDAMESCVTRREAMLLLLHGEPGIGKTSLLEHAAEEFRRRGMRAIIGTAFEAELGNPYGSWPEAVARAASFDLESSAAQGQATEQGRELFFQGAGRKLEQQLQGQRGLSLMFDDAQWMDAGSAQLLHYVLRKHGEQPILIVLAAREGELADNAALQRLLRSVRRAQAPGERTLAPLSMADTEQLVQSQHARAEANGSAGEPAMDASRIARESGGNPLWALELVRSGRSSEGIPTRVSDLLRDRLSLLPPEAGDVLRWASVLGCGFDVARLEELSSLGLERIVGGIEVLLRRAILRPERDGTGDRFAFAHEMVRRVVYADLSGPRRKLMHRRVAELLTRGAEIPPQLSADIAHHASLADDSTLASQAFLTAARRSARLFAAEDAQALARRAAHHAEGLPEPLRTERLIDAAHIALSVGRPELPAEMTQQLESLAERALDLGSVAHARLAFQALGYLSYEAGKLARARDQILEAELVSRGGDESERILGLSEAARCLILLERDLDQAQSLALEASARSRQAGLELAPVLNALGMLKLHQGEFEEAQRSLERARSVARVSRQAQEEFCALEYLAMLAMTRNDCEQAVKYAAELTVLGGKLRGGSEGAFANALLALCNASLSGAENEDELARAITALEQADAKHRLAYVLNRAAQLDLRHNRLTRAMERARRAQRLADLLERPSERLFARLLLVDCANSLGEANLRDELLQDIEELPRLWASRPMQRRIPDVRPRNREET